MYIFAHLKSKLTMKINELKKKLKAFGCCHVGEGKNHEWWWSPITQQRFQIPRHSTADVGKELLKYVKMQSGIDLK